jgi:hypothetical protein
MNRIERRLKDLNGGHFSKFQETVTSVKALLAKYAVNFPAYTDHSKEHVEQVFNLAANLLTTQEIDNLNEDELYVLSCACFLHDVGMCVPAERIAELEKLPKYSHIRIPGNEISTEDFLRTIHHEVSYDFILEEWRELKIIDEKFAKAIALVAMGHRKVDLHDIHLYDPKFFVKNGREFVCLPYISAVLRIADELDVTNVRTPRLLTKYYMPNNVQSQIEWRKHISTTQVNFTEDKVIYHVVCTDHLIFAALQDQFEKITSTINYCQKIIRGISNTEERKFTLNLVKVEAKYEHIGFDPKGIKYSFDVNNVITAFIGDDLYGEKLVSIREALQNSIDSCRYKCICLDSSYEPKVKVWIANDRITIEDNGMGMDEFVIENFFGRLGASYYQQEKVKGTFEAIGQFGVGVFSYFLLGEYVDIETKTATKPALKFRIDKDPKNYFHFFDTCDRNETGTTITIHFKKEYVNKFSSKDIEKYIYNIFRYVDFDILVTYDDYERKIEKRDLQVDIKKDIVPHLDLLYLDLEPNLRLISATIDNENYVGTCSVVVSDNSEDPFIDMRSILDLSGLENSRHHGANGLIDFCQKGIFVTSYESDNIRGVFGNIDIKKKVKINVDRNSFTDHSSIIEIVLDFERSLLEQIGKTYFTEGSDLVKKSSEFTMKYLGYSIAEESIVSVLGHFLTFDVFENGDKYHLQMGEIIDKFDKFIVWSANDKEIPFQCHEIGLPIVQIPRLFLFIDGFVRCLKRYLYVHQVDDFSALIVNSNTDTQSTYNEIVEKCSEYSISGHLCYSNQSTVMVPIYRVSSGEKHDYIYGFNLSSKFISSILLPENQEQFSSNDIRIINNIADYISHAHRGARPIELEMLNKLVRQFSMRIIDEFTPDDFHKNIKPKEG